MVNIRGKERKMANYTMRGIVEASNNGETQLTLSQVRYRIKQLDAEPVDVVNRTNYYSEETLNAILDYGKEREAKKASKKAERAAEKAEFDAKALAEAALHDQETAKQFEQELAELDAKAKASAENDPEAADIPPPSSELAA